VLVLFTAPLTTSTALAQPSTTIPANSVPPPLNKSLINSVISGAGPKPDANYKQKDEACITSATGNTTIPNKPWGQMQLRLEEAHRFATGKGIKVAVIDTGVNDAQPRLGGRVVPGGDYVEQGSGKDGTDDCDGHGTEVAGIIAAGKDQATAFIGVAPDSEIIAIRQTSSKFADQAAGRKTAGRVKTLAFAIVTAVNKGADVINISLTSCRAATQRASEDEPMLQAAIDWAVNEKNVVIVTAAGNVNPTTQQQEEQDPCSPANDNQDPNDVNVVASPPWYANDVLSVASIGREGKVSSFSVWGPWVSIAAPGEEIITIDPKGAGLTNSNVDASNKQDTIQGTSFASPYVAGVAALVRERYPELTARQVMQRLTATATHPGNPNGRDNKVGAGMVNPVDALTAVLPSEQSGGQAAPPPPLKTVLGPAYVPDRTPMIVALSGTGIGVGLLLLTMFVVHTIRKNRADRTT
jgi:membrane-anchored mycosin MYCP